MANTVKYTFVLIIYLMLYVYNQQNYEWDILRNLIKDANNFAVHDAAQEVNDIEKSRGHIIFNPMAARLTFEDTLQMNLGLDPSFTPKPGSRLRDPVEIIEFIIFDDSNSTFPFLYENTTHSITRWIQGPSVVAVIQTNHPEFLQRTVVQDPIKVAAVYEYKPNQ